MLHVEAFICLLLDWLRLVNFRDIYEETKKYQDKHFIKGFYASFDMLHVKSFMRRCEDEKGEETSPLTIDTFPIQT